MAAAADGKSPNPMESARRLAAPVRQRRFYRNAEMVKEEGGFTLRLDGKRAMTPGRRPLAVPDPHFAQAIAAEWSAQGSDIDPATMPATRLANSAIDGVADRLQEVRDGITAYAGTDLLCYRAGEPEGLVARQHELWDPLLAWAEQRFAARFVLAQGVMHVAQPENALRAVEAEVNRFDDPLRLAGLSLATTLTGSALIALAISAGAVGVEEAWRAAHADEDWNISQWGEDPEAMQRRRQRFEDFRTAALALGASHT